MTTVDDVAGELGVAPGQVLEACRTLDILATSGASGLSSAEHRQLRVELDADADLLPVAVGSVDRQPASPALPSSPRRDHAASHAAHPPRRRISPRTMTRIGIYAFLVVAVVVAVTTFNRDEPGTSAGGSGAAAADVEATPSEGACVDLDETTGPPGVVEVPCGEPHDAEVYAAGTVGDGGTGVPASADDPYPGSQAVIAEASAVCGSGRPAPDAALAAVFLVPTATTWEQGRRSIVCMVEDPTGPMPAR